MSSTPVPRPGPAARPRFKTPATAPRRPETPAKKARAVEERQYSSPLARAFPIPRVTIDTLIAGGIVLVALLLRLWALGDRPLHHDESLHATYGYYLSRAVSPEYHYDPMMHGPLQFHMIAFFYSIFGSSPFAARLWSATAGTALVAVPLLLRRQLGRWPMYALMSILALSPTTLYFSRFAREDMQFGLFTMLMVAAMIRFVEDRRAGSPYFYRWLYALAAAFIMAYAGKESIYLSTFIFLLFIGGAIAVEQVRHRRSEGTVPTLLTTALRKTPLKAWGLSTAIVLVMFMLLYWPIGDPPSWAFLPGSHVVSTTLDIPNVIPGAPQSVPYNYSTDGILGGLQYWQAQQPVARGGQPWFYYLLIIPLYEWLVVPFALIGAGYILLRRRVFANLLVLWWTVVTFAIYGWTSEKMPWNSLHLVIPLTVLAAIGLCVSVTAARRWQRYLAIALAIFTGFITLHNSYTLAFVNGANPVEYYVYVQTSPDVPAVYNEMQRIQSHYGGAMPMQVDTQDTWPWAFYLRDNTRWTITAYPAKPADYGAITQPVLLVDVNNYPALSTTLAQRYVAFRENLRWWNPEEYKNSYVYRPDALKHFLGDAVSPTSWSNIWQWELFRRPFTPGAWDSFSNQLDFYFVVRKDMVQYLSPTLQREAQTQIATVARNDPFIKVTRQLQATSTIGAGVGATFSSVGPIAVDRQGHTVVGDPTGHHLTVLGANGSPAHTWGSAGTGPGQFNGQYSPGIGGVAVGPNGDSYATDTWNQRVEEFTAGGAYVRAWGKANLSKVNPKPYEFYGPRGIAVAPNGNVYVADTGHERIQVFDKDGRFLFAFGSPGVAPGQFNEPSSVAIDPSGMVYVADYWNHRIQVFDAQGHALRMFEINAWQAGSYDEPQIAVDAHGHIYVPDPANARMLVYTTTGQPYAAWGGVGQFGKPISAAVGPGNTILVGDAGNAKVLQFTAP